MIEFLKTFNVAKMYSFCSSKSNSTFKLVLFQSGVVKFLYGIAPNSEMYISLFFDDINSFNSSTKESIFFLESLTV